MNEDSPQADLPTPRMIAWARNSALYRLGRQMLTEKQLFEAITRKGRLKFEGISEAQLKAVADFAVSFAYDINALDDTVYAETSTRSAVRNGKSKRMIAQRLSRKGIENAVADAALDQADDLLAAVIFARKRGFGPFRRGDLDDRRKAKELSAFARNGFSFEIGKRIFLMRLPDAEEILSSGLSL